MKIRLNKGHSTLDLDITDEKVIDILIGKDVPALGHENIINIIENGIRNHTPAHIEGKKIAVVIPDNTRLWARGDLFVPHIIKTLVHMGASKDNITIIIATGTHHDIDKLEFAQIAGAYCSQIIKMVNAANKNKERLVYIGTTHKKTDLYITKEAAEADHIIIFGGVLHHMIAGFGGGRKYILPGIAGYDAIQQNHALAIREDGQPHPLVRQGKLWGNPVNEDLNDAAHLFLQDKTATYVAVAANGTGDLFHAAVGDLETTFMDACRELDRACCVPVDKKADFVIISTGGHRADTQLYQSTKALFNAVNIVKEGGQILFVAGCTDGVGNQTFADTLNRYKGDAGPLGKELVKKFNMPAYVAFRIMDILNRFEVTLYSDLPGETAEKIGFSYTTDIESYVHKLTGKGYIIPFAENILPVIKGD